MGICEKQKDIIIRIRYENEIRNIKIKQNSTFEVIIRDYINNFVNPKYDVSKYTLKLNEKKINHNEIISSYINYINNNCIFDLILGNVIPECGFVENNKKEPHELNNKKDEMEIDIL